MQAAGNPDSGVVLMRQAVALLEAGGGTRLLSGMSALAELLRLSGRQREAVPYQRRVLSELAAAGYGETEAFPNVVSQLERSLSELGEFGPWRSSPADGG